MFDTFGAFNKLGELEASFHEPSQLNDFAEIPELALFLLILRNIHHAGIRVIYAVEMYEEAMYLVKAMNEKTYNV